jgi:hypothetical protein
MFVKLNSPEDAENLHNKLANGGYFQEDVTLVGFELATQTYPVIVFVETDYDADTHTIHFPSKIHTLEEL